MAAYHAGDWIWAEDEFAMVECVQKIYYEEFDDEVAYGERKVGDYKETVVAYRGFCGRRGGLKKNRARAAFDGADWLRPVTDEELAVINKVIDNDVEAYRRWLERKAAVRDYVDVDVPVKEGTGRAELAKLKKAVKRLPPKFTFDELLEQAKAEGFDMKPAEGGQPDDPRVSFTLRCNVGESRGCRRLFCGVKDIDCTEPDEDEAAFDRLITFEGVFILLGQTVKFYDNQHPSDDNKALLERLGHVFTALLNHDWKGCPMAKDYFKHAPKLFTFSREQVWEIITGFLERNAEELGAQAFLAAIDGGDEVKSICFSIYDASVGA